MYSEQVLDHFQNPRHVGELEDATVSVEVSNPVCGDILRLSARVEGGRFAEVRFRAKGCVPAIACGSKLAEMLYGARIAQTNITRDQLIFELGGLPQGSDHASHLAMAVLKLAREKIAEGLREPLQNN
jgi:nitrogen fixation NifU-like protein